jgi:predicted small lipoprotein YifL
MKKLKLILPLVLTIVMIAACSKKEIGPDNTPPADHTINKDGYFHKTGLNDPLANCTTCHGQDLSGGTSAVSCFECHGTKW